MQCGRDAEIAVGGDEVPRWNTEAALTPNEIGNWTAVYAATAACCAFALLLSVATVSIEIARERGWQSVCNLQSATIFGAKLWWRWQKRYLLSTPVTLSIVGWFAATLDWAN